MFIISRSEICFVGKGVTFDTGTILANGDVYIIAHPSANGDILAEADQTHTYLSNGDDAYALTLAGATADTYTIIDIVAGPGWPFSTDIRDTFIALNINLKLTFI